MRTTLNLDENLIARAREVSGITEKTKLINHALQAMIRSHAYKSLAAAGGTMPDLEVPPRFRMPATRPFPKKKKK
jgi:Arc/MetJ family transcription regulator